MSNLIVENVNGVDADAGKAKAWANWNGVTPSLDNSFNVPSLVDNGTGDFTLNFTSVFANITYCASGYGGNSADTATAHVLMHGANSSIQVGSHRTYTLGVSASSGGPSDKTINHGKWHGDLA